VLGDNAYAMVVRLNRWLSWVRRTLKMPGYWSLSGYAKHKVKKAVSFIFDFENSVLRHAMERGVDGVICGHITRRDSRPQRSSYQLRRPVQHLHRHRRA
jgi:UDP-2,3-diacylglucosamine pyrophosphatase LpxH